MTSGLTNWSAETISIAYERFSFFKEFDGIVVSGQEKMIKPDYKIYQLLLNRYNLKAENSLYPNLVPARELRIQGVMVSLVRKQIAVQRRKRG